MYFYTFCVLCSCFFQIETFPLEGKGKAPKTQEVNKIRKDQEAQTITSIWGPSPRLGKQ